MESLVCQCATGEGRPTTTAMETKEGSVTGSNVIDCEEIVSRQDQGIGTNVKLMHQWRVDAASIDC